MANTQFAATERGKSGHARDDAGASSGWGAKRERWQRTWTGLLRREVWGRWGPVAKNTGWRC